MTIPAVWRARFGLFSVLLLLIAVNAAVLISYNGFYESRIRSLHETRKTLEQRKLEGTAALERLKDKEAKLRTLREELEEFTRRRSAREKSVSLASSKSSTS